MSKKTMTEEERERLAITLKHYRKQAGLTQTELTQGISLSSGCYSDIECMRAAPSLKVLMEIADALDVATYKIIRDAAL